MYFKILLTLLICSSCFAQMKIPGWQGITPAGQKAIKDTVRAIVGDSSDVLRSQLRSDIGDSADMYIHIPDTVGVDSGKVLQYQGNGILQWTSYNRPDYIFQKNFIGSIGLDTTLWANIGVDIYNNDPSGQFVYAPLFLPVFFDTLSYLAEIDCLKVVIYAGAINTRWDAAIWDLDDKYIAPITYIETQDFEEVGAPSGFSIVSGSADSVNYDYSPALEANKSLKLDRNVQVRKTMDAEYSEIWFRFRMKPNLNGAASAAFYLYDTAGSTIQCYFNITAAPVIKLFDGSANNTGFTVLSDDTEYYVWLHYKKGTGVNSLADLYISTTSTKPGSPECSITNGTSTSDIKHYQFVTGSGAAIQDNVYDEVIVDDANIS